MWNRIKENSIVLFIILATVIVTVLASELWFSGLFQIFFRYPHYEKAVVVEVSAENVEYERGLRSILELRN